MRVIGSSPEYLALANGGTEQTVQDPVTFTDNVTFSGGTVTFTGDIIDGKLPKVDQLRILNTSLANVNTQPQLALNKTVADQLYAAKSAHLTAISALTPAADKFIYFINGTTANIATVTQKGREFLALTTTAAMIDYLSAGETIWTSANDGHGTGLDADKLDTYHLQGATGTNYWTVIPKVDGSGLTHVGKTLSFHNIATSNAENAEVTLSTKGTAGSLYIDDKLVLTEANYSPYVPSKTSFDSLTATVSGKVAKAGDTMTGTLSIKNIVPALYLRDTNHNTAVAIASTVNQFRVFGLTPNTGDGHLSNFNWTDDVPVMKIDLGATIHGNVTFKGDITAFSDERLKKNIQPLYGALALVNQLSGVSFTHLLTGKESVGVIAQQVEKVLPQLVYEDETGYKKVAYIPLIALLIEAVKELSDAKGS